MNNTKTNQELIQFNAKKESFELNIEDNDLGMMGKFVRGWMSNKNPYKLIRFDKLKMYK